MIYVKILGILLPISGVIFFVIQWNAIYGHQITMATVTNLIPSMTADGTTYKVVAKFNDINGKEWNYTSSISSDPPAHSVGDHFKIMYESTNPENNRSLKFWTRFGFSWIMIGLGLLMLWIYIGSKYGDELIYYSFPNSH